MTTLAQLQAERATFIAAYQSYLKTGKGITKSQLDTALAANQAQQDALKAQQTPPTYNPSVSPMPPDISSSTPQVVVGGVTYQNVNTPSNPAPTPVTPVINNPVSPMPPEITPNTTTVIIDGTEWEKVDPTPKINANVSPLPPDTSTTWALKEQTATGVTTWQNVNTPIPDPDPLPTLPVGPNWTAQATIAAYNDPTMRNIVVPVIEVAAITAAAIVAPEIVIPSVIIGEVANIGINSGFKSYETGQLQLVLPTTLREVTDNAVISTAFGFVGAGAIGGVAAVAPRLAGTAANPIVALATRMAVNTGIGAGGGALLGGGNPDAIYQGAAFGAAFGAMGEVAAVVGPRVTPKIPLLKYGDVDLTFVSEVKAGTYKGIEADVYEGSINWKGLYVSKGSEAKPILGKFSNVPDNSAHIKTIVGETEGFKPHKNIEAELTRDVLLQRGEATKFDIEANRAIVEGTTLAQTVKNPKHFAKTLPHETQTSTKAEMTELKKFILKNSDIIEELFGKFSAVPQENPDLPYKITYKGKTGKTETASSDRTTMDADIRLKQGTPLKRVKEFVDGVYEIYKVDPHSGVTKKGSLIETKFVNERANPNADTHHAVDIHSEFDKLFNPFQQGDDSSLYDWGIKVKQPTTKIEGLPVASLRQQVAGKARSILNIQPEGSPRKFGPVPHRAKDIPDWFNNAHTLAEQIKPSKLEQMKLRLNSNSAKDAKNYTPKVKAKLLKDMKIAAEYYGVEGPIAEIKGSRMGMERYVFDTPSKPVSPRRAASLPAATIGSLTGYAKDYAKPSQAVKSIASQVSRPPSYDKLIPDPYPYPYGKTKPSTSKPSTSKTRYPDPFKPYTPKPYTPDNRQSPQPYPKYNPDPSPPPYIPKYNPKPSPDPDPPYPKYPDPSPPPPYNYNPYPPYDDQRVYYNGYDNYRTPRAKNPFKTIGGGFGGGFDFSPSPQGKGSQWFQKKHKIKTYSQMLETVGMGGAGKSLKGVEKALKPLDKATRRMDKNFNKKAGAKRKR